MIDTDLEESRRASQIELVIRSAYLLLVYRLMNCGFKKQAEAFSILADNPELRERIAESILSEEQTSSADAPAG